LHIPFVRFTRRHSRWFIEGLAVAGATLGVASARGCHTDQLRRLRKSHLSRTHVCHAGCEMGRKMSIRSIGDSESDTRALCETFNELDRCAGLNELNAHRKAVENLVAALASRAQHNSELNTACMQ
jgi:hypothetical protein